MTDGEEMVCFHLDARAITVALMLDYLPTSTMHYLNLKIICHKVLQHSRHEPRSAVIDCIAVAAQPRIRYLRYLDTS